MSRADERIDYKEFSIPYQELCFSIWYASGQPGNKRLVDLIPEDEHLGKKASLWSLDKWKAQNFWKDRAESIDAEVQANTDRQLVKIRMDMMTKHAEIAAEIVKAASEFILTSGFDSSTSAVNALFRGMEAEKQSRGVAGALAKVFSMDDDQLKREMDRLLTKTNDVGGDDTVDAEVEVSSGISEET